MEDYTNFLNNLRNSQREVWQKVDGATNQTNDFRKNFVSPLEQKFYNTNSAPSQGITIREDQISPSIMPMKTLSQLLASVPKTSNDNTNTGYTYQRDPGIDTFVSALRYIMNPIRGITGDTPLDLAANQISDSLYSSFGKEVPSEKTTTANAATENVASADTTTPTDEESDVITYTYKPGDTFGQVILDLGLNTGKGLWGSDGDVEYYTKQLEDQLWNSGVWERGSRQNIPIGTTIKLKRRKLNDVQ